VSGTSKFLRPKAATTDQSPIDGHQTPDDNTDVVGNLNIVVNRQKSLDLMNDVNAKHRKLSSSQQDVTKQCGNPKFKFKKTVPKGMTEKWILVCEQCNYVSETYPLYESVQSPNKDAKAATMNVGFQVGLQETTP
jgi:hypothetical protein